MLQIKIIPINQWIQNQTKHRIPNQITKNAQAILYLKTMLIRNHTKKRQQQCNHMIDNKTNSNRMKNTINPGRIAKRQSRKRTQITKDCKHLFIFRQQINNPQN